MKYIYILLIVALTILTKCSSRQERETKYPLTDNLAEKFEIVESDNGSFLKDGYYKSWYPNGQIKDDGTYKNNNKTGTWTEYYSNGVLKSKGEFLDGNRIGAWNFFYANSKEESTLKYNSDGKQDGMATGHHENGKIKFEILYKNGTKNGHWKFYNEDGNVVRESKFIDSVDQILVGEWKSKEGTIVFESSGDFFYKDYPKERSKYIIEDNSLILASTRFSIKKLTEKEYKLVEMNGFLNPKVYSAERIIAR